ncbi:MAG: CoA transferase [Candidatus Rokubacteria bacterium]|nr:CoA transferase [Candidatus Rokubacteria bacterium]
MEPLAGIRVVDLTSYIAGSYAAMMLADLGARVDKVESLEGDSFRELPGFHGWNRGKRSIAVNLKAPEGRAIVERLAARGDVVMENMRPGVADRLGVGEARLRGLNPRLIYCSITAFGSTGPYADRPGFDPLLQALAGVMTLQGFGGPPQYVRIAITDYYAAALGTQAVLAALFARERTGQGQRVETSLLQAALALQSGNVVDYAGKQSTFRDNPTYRLYQASDGEWLFLACGNQTFWVKLCTALRLERLADDPRFASWLLRLDNREALLPLLEETFRAKPRSHWLDVLAAHDIPAAPVQPLAEFMDDPAVRHHAMVREYDHPDVGRLRLMGQPLGFSATPARDPGPPPALGQHTGEVLRELGWDDAAIADLEARAVVRRPGAGAPGAPGTPLPRRQPPPPAPDRR